MDIEIEFDDDPTDWSDADGDGFGAGDGLNPSCPCVPNPSSAACDSALDGIANTSDNCPTVSNSGQADLDADGAGDACDGDIDCDGVANDDERD